MTREQKAIKEQFDKLDNRGRAQILHTLSQPWIEKGVIDTPVIDIQTIFDFNNRSKVAKSRAKKYRNNNSTPKKKKR